MGPVGEKRPGDNALAAYKKKRNFAKTPEPAGKQKKTSKRLKFVIQKHDATRLHYDFRLEANGVLASWAVPKGPSLVPGTKSLAMHVEDHPMDYGDFEGVIPAGEYGAGEVIVWDNGWYELFEGDDAADEIASGKIKFIMHGQKMTGIFTLVRIKPREHESGDPWLLIKDYDDKNPKQYDINDYPESVKTGKTLDDIRAEAKKDKAAVWHSFPVERKSKRESARASGKAKAEPMPVLKSVMLATTIDEPFDDDEWLFEIKWDGYRAICTIDAKGTLTLKSRNGTDFLKQFPDMENLVDAFKSIPIMVDGEIVSLDDKGRSDFGRLQDAANTDTQLTYVAFDVMYADGRDQRNLPLEKRKALLERLIVDEDLVMYSKHVEGKGKALFAQAKRNHLEGIIGKKRASVYEERRTRDWVKIKAQCDSEFVVAGWTDPGGSRKGFGSLLLGAYVGEELRFVGAVGTGFTVKRIGEIMKMLKPLARATSPFANVDEAPKDAHWVKPELIAQVRFTEWTRDHILRQPAFLGFREDKDPQDVVLELPEHRKEREPGSTRRRWR